MNTFQIQNMQAVLIVEKGGGDEDNSRKGVAKDGGWRCVEPQAAWTSTTHATIWTLNSTSNSHKRHVADLYMLIKFEGATYKEGVSKREKVRSEESLLRIPLIRRNFLSEKKLLVKP